MERGGFERCVDDILFGNGGENGIGGRLGSVCKGGDGMGVEDDR